MAPTHAPGLTGLHHVALRVADLERSLALYRDTLGFDPKVAFSLHGFRFAWLETGNSGYIELVEVGRPVTPTRDEDVAWHLALRTDDVASALEAVRKAGYTITREVTPLTLENTAAGGHVSVRVAFFRGPDGEEVELIEESR